MILFMITKTSTTSSSHIKESAIDACRDFIITGHSEPKAFMERCRDGVSSLPLETSTEERRNCFERGLQVVQSKHYTAALVTGIIFKMGYSHKPECDLQSMLNDFDSFEQKPGEKAHEYVNRFQGCLSDLSDATSLLNKSSHYPSEGAILSRLKSGANADLREQAHHILRYIDRIPVADATYVQFKAALLHAQKFISEDNDLKALKNKNKKPAPSPAASLEGKKKDQDAAEDAKVNQDPALTHKLRDNRICVSNVAFEVGKQSKPCRYGEACTHKHLLPADIGLINKDYCNFIVVYDHLKTQTAEENKYVAVLNNGQIPPSNNSMVGAPALAICDKNNDSDQPEELVPPRSGIAAAALSAPLIHGPEGNAPVPSFMHGAVPLD